MMKRRLTRITLVAAGLFSVGVIVASLVAAPDDFAASTTVAAALAVLTSIFAAWSAQQGVELQQDALSPYPYPSADFTSRHKLIQLRVTNTGGGAAHDIRLVWHKPLLNMEGKQVRFTPQVGAPEIAVLLPQQSASVLIGGVKLFQIYQDMNYSGEIEFKDASGKKMKHPFSLSLEQYRRGLTYSEEMPMTHYQLQQIPGEIEDLTSAVERIGRLIERVIERGKDAGEATVGADQIEPNE